MNFISLSGFLLSKAVDGRAILEFSIGDIYMQQKNKWIKEDSKNDSALFNNMQIVKVAKSLAFYTTGKYATNYLVNSQNETVLFKNIVEEDKRLGSKTFTLKIIGMTSNSGLIAKCFDCELVKSMVAPTPIGTVQCNEVKFSDMTIERLGDSTAGKKQ